MTDTAQRLSSALADRYTIERELGAGGMATVYLAEDLRHHRQVALKVLRPEVSAVLGVPRFLTEIQVTASLQHPHILPLFDSGTHEGLLYYVMPLVKGESLRERLARDKQLGIEEALRIATQVSGALDYAHRRGVIHRDIKPENILLAEGQALVADFGIALALQQSAGGRLTEIGMSLGTPQYMSPEQTLGERDLDGRSDIYSLGCVLYEALAGEPPHSGPTAATIIARVVSAAPRPVSEVRPTTPFHVAAALDTALAKLPADRFATAADFASALTNPAFGTWHRGASSVDRRAASRGRGRLLGWTGVATVLAVLAIWGWSRKPRTAVEPTTRVRLAFAPSEGLEAAHTLRFALAPAGRRIVYVGRDSMGTKLWVRDLGALNATPLAGTEGAVAPFFSPDGENVGFFVRHPHALRVTPVAGGPVRTLVADSVSPWGGDWSADGWLYFTSASGCVERVRESGGRPELVSKVDWARAEREHDWVSLLPGGATALVELWHTSVSDPQVGLLDLRTGTTRPLAAGVIARYDGHGHLVYATSEGRLWVAPFDVHRGAMTGAARPVLEGVAIDQTSGAAEFALSATGTLVYQTGGERDRQQLVFVDRSGRAAPVDSTWWGTFSGPAISPDGRHVAVNVQGTDRADIWLRSLRTGALTRLTFEGQPNYRPEWTPDGEYLTFVTAPAGARQGLWRKRMDGAAPAEPVVSSPTDVDEGFIAPAGWVVYRQGAAGIGTRDVLGMKLGRVGVPRPLVANPPDEYSPALSPDGRWLAFVSDGDVYVRPFPETGRALWEISTNGGAEPVWAHSGRELFYRGPRGELLSVEVQPGRGFTVGRRREVLPASASFETDDYHPAYAIMPDDRRFVMIRSDMRTSNTGLVLVLNWSAELAHRQ